MKPFRTIESTAVPLPENNIDTDQIIPARFLKYPRTKPDGYGPYFFHDLRFNDAGAPRADFILHSPKLRDSRIVIAKENFGCGSSREAAVWALLDYGIGAVLAKSFGDIFYNSAFKNGLLPIRLESDAIDALLRSLKSAPTERLVVNLEAQQVGLVYGKRYSFMIDPFRRDALLNGLDEIDMTCRQASQINLFARSRFTAHPWLQPTQPT